MDRRTFLGLAGAAIATKLLPAIQPACGYENYVEDWGPCAGDAFMFAGGCLVVLSGPNCGRRYRVLSVKGTVMSLESKPIYGRATLVANDYIGPALKLPI